MTHKPGFLTFIKVLRRLFSAFMQTKPWVEEVMSQAENSKAEPQPIERIPFMQRVLDNPFLLLFLGVVIPTVLYIVWGVMEITNIPLAK